MILDRADLGKSFLFHIAVLCSIALITYYRYKFSNPMEIPEAIQVDLVGLPDQLKSQETPMDISKKAEPEAQEPTKEEQEKDEVKVPTKDKLHDAMDAIKRFKAMEKIKEKKEPPKNAKTSEETKGTNARQLLKGNFITVGNSATGVVMQAGSVEQFGAAIIQEVKRYWELPSHLMESNYKAVAVIYISEDGRKLNAYIVKGSGNKEFDDYVSQALNQVEFLPVPPEELKEKVKKDGVTLRFPLR